MAEEYINLVVQTAVPRAMTTREIEEASAVDEELENLRLRIETGDWENPKCARYKHVREELCVLGKIKLMGTRIVIPQKLCARVIELGHEGYQGIAKMNHRL